jgi:hypothetical protein
MKFKEKIYPTPFPARPAGGDYAQGDRQTERSRSLFLHSKRY